MCQRNITSLKRIGRITHFCNLISSQDMSPSLRIISIILALPNGWTSDFFWEIRVWFDLVVQGRMLTRSFDTAKEVVVVVGRGRDCGCGWGLVVVLLGFLGRRRRIGLTFFRFGSRSNSSSTVIVRKRGCQTRSHGIGSGSWKLSGRERIKRRRSVDKEVELEWKDNEKGTKEGDWKIREEWDL